MLEGYLIRIVYVIAYYSVWSCELWDFDSNILIPTVAIFTENLLVFKILLPANTVALRLSKIVQKKW